MSMFRKPTPEEQSKKTLDKAIAGVLETLDKETQALRNKFQNGQDFITSSLEDYVKLLSFQEIVADLQAQIEKSDAGNKEYTAVTEANLQTQLVKLEAKINNIKIPSLQGLATGADIEEAVKALRRKLQAEIDAIKKELKDLPTGSSLAVLRGALAKLVDVEITSLADDDILQYNSTTQKWENVPLPAPDLTPYARLDGTNQPFTGNVTAPSYLTTSNTFNIGNGNSVSGTGAVAIGTSSSATNLATFAAGVGANATGLISTAMGVAVNASGSTSLAMGRNVTASANNSAIFGWGSSAVTNSTADSLLIAYTASNTMRMTTSLTTFSQPVVGTTFNGVALTTSGSASNFLNAQGNYVPAGATPAGANTQIQYNNSGVFGASGNLTFDGTRLGTSGIGVELPTTSPVITITGTISSITTSVNDANVVGSGTQFLSEFQIGDRLVHPTLSYLSATVTRISSNTSMSLVGTVLSGYNGASWRRFRDPLKERHASGASLRAASYGDYNPISGASDIPIHLIRGNVLFQNTESPNLGIWLRTTAADGRMRMGHINSSAYIQFAGSNSAITIDNATIQNSFWAAPIYAGAASGSGNETSLFINRSGTGANQTIYLHTMRYAANNDAPALEIAGNGVDIGIRNGSFWNEGIDNKIINIGKTNGNISVGSLGTGAVTETTVRMGFVTVGDTLGFKTGTNATIGQATLSGGTVTINTNKITANSMIKLSPPRGSVANLGIHYEPTATRIAGTSFTITSTNAADNSTFDWHIVEKI